MKLCDVAGKPEVRLPSTPSMEEVEDTFDRDLRALESHTTAYESLTAVYGEVCSEQFNFVDKRNYTLFNEYMKLMSRNLGIVNPPMVSLEAVEVLPTAALNHHLALEGFIGTMWDKVKKLFIKIYESVKAFFAKHFTRLGRLKKKLENLHDVLKETETDLKQVNLDSVPSSLASKFPVSGTISETLLEKSVASGDLILAVLEETNKGGLELANRDILSRDFVAKVKSLKDKLSDTQGKIDENNDKKVGGVKGLYGEGKAKNKELKGENKTLSETAKETAGQLKDEKEKLSNVVGDNEDMSVDDKAFEVAKKEMGAYIRRVESAFKKLVNQPTSGGKVLKEVKVTQDDGIEVEFDTEKETPSDVTLSSKAGLLKLVSEALSTLVTMEKMTDNYTKVNDTVMKNMDTVDKLIADLDKVTGQNENAYKKILQNKVKERLKLMQTFFSTYNKVNKNLMTMVADIGDGVVAYAVVSLKHFG